MFLNKADMHLPTVCDLLRYEYEKLNVLIAKH